MRLGVLADDFTGAIDTGVSFTSWGYDVWFYLTEEQSHSDKEVVIATTLSREIPEELAIQRTQQMVAHMSERRLFKKIDSTMRGHVASEIHAILGTSNLPAAVICPATIETGRTIENGLLYVHGNPLSQTAFAHDPYWPATSDEMTRLLRNPDTIHIPLSVVRRGADVLATVFSQTEHPLITVDASNHHDLLTIASATLKTGLLPCGAMGFCKAWIQVMHGSAPTRQPSSSTIHNPRFPLLLIIGSAHPANQQQVSYLEDNAQTEKIQLSAGCSFNTLERDMLQALERSPLVLLQMPAERITDADTLHDLRYGIANMVQSVIQQVKIAGLVVVGGETASIIASNLQISAIQILREIEAGVPLGRIIGGLADSLLIVTKAGGFGSERTLGSIAKWFGAWQERKEE